MTFPLDWDALQELLEDATEQVWRTGKAVVELDGCTLTIDYTNEKA